MIRFKINEQVRVKNDAYWYQGCKGTISGIGQFTDGSKCIGVIIEGESGLPKGFTVSELENVNDHDNP